MAAPATGGVDTPRIDVQKKQVEAWQSEIANKRQIASNPAAHAQYITDLSSVPFVTKIYYVLPIFFKNSWISDLSFNLNNDINDPSLIEKLFSKSRTAFTWKKFFSIFSLTSRGDSQIKDKESGDYHRACEITDMISKIRELYVEESERQMILSASIQQVICYDNVLNRGGCSALFMFSLTVLNAQELTILKNTFRQSKSIQAVSYADPHYRIQFKA